MNNELPIVVQPSRLIWGMLALSAVAGIAFIVYVVAFTDALGDDEWLKWWMFAIVAFFGFEMLFAAWNFLFAPPRMVVDENGVGGRFAAGGSAGAERIAWGDITGARHISEYSFLSRSRYFFIVLDVVNIGGKYPAGKIVRWWSPFAWWEKFLLSGCNYTFAFNITNTKLKEERAKEIVEIINSRAKGKPPEDAKESGKSPFATDE